MAAKQQMHSQDALQEKYCSGILNNQHNNGNYNNGIVLPMLMKAVLYICPNTSEKRGNVSSAGMLEETTDEPDDSLLYAVVIGLLYVFIMVSLIFANIHPSRSLIADLKKYESLTDVNLNEDLPFELAQMMKLEMKHGSNAPLRDLRTSVPSCRAEHSYFSTAYQKTGATRTPYMT